jgi:hypothetical protein
VLDLLILFYHILLNFMLSMYVVGVSSWQAGMYFEDKIPMTNYLESLLKV